MSCVLCLKDSPFKGKFPWKYTGVRLLVLSAVTCQPHWTVSHPLTYGIGQCVLWKLTYRMTIVCKKVTSLGFIDSTCMSQAIKFVSVNLSRVRLQLSSHLNDVYNDVNWCRYMSCFCSRDIARTSVSYSVCSYGNQALWCILSVCFFPS